MQQRRFSYHRSNIELWLTVQARMMQNKRVRVKCLGNFNGSYCWYNDRGANDVLFWKSFNAFLRFPTQKQFPGIRFFVR